MQVLNTICDVGIVPIFYHNDIETVKNVVKSCYKGGVRIFEFTNRGEFAHETFGELNKFIAKECPDLILGAGSIIDASTASLYIQLGANFIVSPMFDSNTVQIVNKRLIPYIPGCGSILEVGVAQKSGCDLCKIFPGDVLGPNFIKNIKAPMPWSMLMVTGGVKAEEKNLKSWFDAGATCVGLGSDFFKKETIENKEWDRIKKMCNDTLMTISRIR
jgi:2-dehydro-3-deoxyphosphogluconate aldolase/(4S)-4-hydroxy-2-oxoglutarate aldolase